MNDLAIIGLDAQFANQSSIDRFERSVYQGLVQATNYLLDQRDIVALCCESVERLAKANALALKNIHVILLADKISENDIALFSKHFLSFVTVSSLSAAFLLFRQNPEMAKQSTAIVGFNLLGEESHVVKNIAAKISFDTDFSGYQVVEGIASVLVSSAEFAKQQHAYIYASIKGFSAANDIATACAQALNDSSFTVNDIKYVETSALADELSAFKEMKGLIKAYNTDNILQTAIGSLRSVTGEGRYFSQVAGLVKTVIALYQRYYPGIIDWQAPKLAEWQDSPFYFPTESRPCFPNSNGKPLVAAYSCMSSNDYCHFVLQENQEEELRSNGYMACSELVMIPLSADSQTALFTQLQDLQSSLTDKTHLQELAQTHYLHFKKSRSSFTLCLLAESLDELRKEILLALEGLPQSFKENHEWKTPKGSFFSPEPVQEDKNVAFVYPGIGATYIGLGRDIFHLFPEIYLSVAKLADDIASSLKDKILNPRTLVKPDFATIKAMDHDLRNHLPNIAECGVGFACVFTKVFEEVFKVKADFSAGYSMGEISMYAALGCWKKPGAMSERLAKSDTFNHRLTGELETLRQHWGLPHSPDGKKEKLWETYTLKATPEEVAEACEDEDRVYCTIINTPDSLVIGGYPEACERVIKKLGVRGMSLDIQNAIHSEPAFKEYESMEALFTMDVSDRLDTKIYSSSCYLPVPQRTKSIANSISKCLCDPVDFPRLINTVYDKGARVFIEMGPGRSLCSWIDKILKHDEIKPHVSVPVNAKGVNDELTIMRAIAKLVSHGVNIDMTSIYFGSLIKQIENNTYCNLQIK